MTDRPRQSLAVLLTNVWLDRRGGTEAVIRDIALGLLKRGHRPIVYSPHLGEPAQELHQRGVAVINSLSSLAEPPDVIHGQHFIQTAEAILHFPQTPAIQMCHAWQHWAEGPAKFPQIHRYVAADQTVRDRLVHMEQIPPERVEVVYNAVDLTRMPERTTPLSAKPATALAFTKTRAQLPFVEAACRRHGVKLDVLGKGADRTVRNPELELVKYDLVFATARMALEALCAGCAVIVCDSRGLSGMVSTENLSRLRPLNFGLRSLVHPVTVDGLAGEIDRYDPADAARVAETVRAMAGLEATLDYLEQLYQRAMGAPRPREDEVGAATLQFLQRALPRQRTDGRWPWMAEREAMESRIDQLERELAAERTKNLAP
jgi:hypothetical protein